jgi:type IV secretion system protein VirB8
MTKENVPTMKQAAGRVPQEFADAAADFLRSKIEELKHSRKVAFWIAGVATSLCFLAVIAWLIATLTRTEPEPTIIQVDKSTGATTVLRSVKDTKDKYDEVVNKYWLATYVRQREGYDWYTISEQFEAVKLMSESDVADEYSKKVQSANAPLTTLKDKAKIVAKVSSIAFVGDLAQVRFTTEKQSMSGDNSDNAPVQKWIATIAYSFKAGLMTDQQRLINPLGYKTISYRVDPEVIK